MNEHLPECLVPDFDKGLWICICNQLRACEQRVQKIAYAQGLGAGSDEHGQHEIGWMKGYDAALDAAREAVASVEGGYSVPLEMPVGAFVNAMRREHLAAIDALQKEPND